MVKCSVRIIATVITKYSNINISANNRQNSGFMDSLITLQHIIYPMRDLKLVANK